MLAAAPVLVVEDPAQAGMGRPGGGQRLADGGGLDRELAAPAGVGRQQRGQADPYGGYVATLRQSTRAKLAGRRDQLSPSSALV